MRINHRMIGALCVMLFWTLSASAQLAETGQVGAPVAIPPASGPAPAGVGAAWEVMAPIPEARVFNAVAADANGYVYSIGGTPGASGPIASNSLYRYDTATDSWALLTPVPVPLYSANAVVVNNRIYVPGDSTTANTYIYDIADDSWSVVAANGGYTARSQYQVLTSGTDVIVLGGIVAALNTSTNEVWILDTVTETWSAGTPMQQSRTSFSAGLIGGQIVAAGGVAFPGFVPDMTTEIFDGTSWTFAAGVPTGGGAYTRWSYNAAAAVGGQLWLAGGRRDTNWNILSHAGFYDPASDSWTDSPAIPALNQGRVYMEGAVASDGYFYVIGGRDSAASVIYSNNERLFVGGAPTFDVGGAISGLLGSGLVVEDVESGQTLNLNAPDSAYAFTLADSAAYDIQIQTQPGAPQQTCTVANATGVVSGADVTNVDIICTTDEFNVGGSINGLAGSGLVLIEIDSGQTLSIAAMDVSYAFSLEDGSSYDIQIQTQPGGPQQTCTVINPGGAVNSADVTNVDINCTTDEFNVGGSINGLAGSGLVLIEIDSGQTLNIAAMDVSYAFSLEDGSSYNIQIQTQPGGPQQTCTVINASGVVNAADVTNAQINCATDVFSVGGAVSGLTGPGLELIETDSGLTQSLPAAATSHAFSLVDGSTYTVEVNTQPAGQICTVSSPSGSVNGADVTDVDVACVDLTIGISAGQLAFGTLTVGQTADALLTVSNTGGGPLDLTAVSLTGPVGIFGLSGGTCLPTPTTLAPAASCTIEVTMDGSSLGNYQGELVIESTAAGSPTNVGLSGNVTSAALPVPTLNMSMLLLLMISLLLIGSFALRTR